MPAPVDWITRLVVIAALLRLLVEVRRLRREVHRRDARDAEVAGQVQRLMSRRRPNAGEDAKDRRRRFWVPSVAFLAAVGGWAKHYSGPIAGVVSAVAAVTLFVIAGSGGSTHHEGQVPDPVAPAPPTEAPPPSPTSTTVPPPHTTTVTAPPRTPAAEFAMDAETPTRTPTSTTTVPTVPTVAITTTTSSPTMTTAPTPTGPCRLRVTLTPVADLCVST